MKNLALAKIKEEEEIGYWQKTSEELRGELRKKTDEWLQVSGRLKEEISKRTDAEKKLFDCYEYLGIVNRQLAILLNLKKDSDGKNGKIAIEFVLDSALNFSKADVAAFYKYNKSNGELRLVSAAGAERSRFKTSFIGTGCELLKPLFEKKVRVNGRFESRKLKEAGLDLEVNYFLALPIIRKNEIKGVLFLGFNDKKSVTTQELDLYEAFSIQASYLLAC